MRFCKHLSGLLAPAVGLFLASALHAQLYVGGYNVPNGGGSATGTVITVDPITGAVTNASFITGLATTPDGIVLDGKGNLFVKYGGKVGKYDAATGTSINNSFADLSSLGTTQSMAIDDSGNLLIGTLNGAIAKYDGTTGALIDANFITVPHPYGIALDGKGHLFASTFTLDYVGEFDANTGALLNGGASGGLEDPWGIAVDSSGHLFVANEASSAIAEFDSTTGVAINPNLFSCSSAAGLTIDGSGNLFVAGYTSDGVVKRYDAATGIVTTFNTGLDRPLAVAIAPEPSALALIGLCLAGMLRRVGRRQ